MSSQTENADHNNKALDKFGAFLMHEVRDKSLVAIDSVIDGRMKGESAQSVYHKV